MAPRNKLFVEKLLVWVTKIPFEGKTRRSSNFWLMGSEWYLQFSYKKSPVYHVLSLHRANVGGEPQQMIFTVRTHVRNPTTQDFREIDVQNARITRSDGVNLWYSGRGNVQANERYIFEILPWLCSSSEIQFVCRFCGKPPSVLLEISTELSKTESPSDLECLSRDLGSLLEGEQLPDVRLKCGGRTFPAHRSVLAARSEVFAAMFRNPMAESQTGGVDIQDFDSDVLRHFLHYLYTSKLTEESEDLVVSLFATDKYAVHSLKEACTRWMVSGLTEGSCVRYLTVAGLHGGDTLKREVAQFVCGHPAVMLGEEWGQFSEENAKLALEVHRSFVRSKTET